MYFTNDNPKKKSIMQVTMGGADKFQLFSVESSGDLAVDKQGKKLYWTDIHVDLKKIECGDLTGKHTIIIQFIYPFLSIGFETTQ